MEQKSIWRQLFAYDNDENLLTDIFLRRFGGMPCLNRRCNLTTDNYALVKGRKCFQCSKCGKQVYPLKGTIAHASPVPLRVWLRTIAFQCCFATGINSLDVEAYERMVEAKAVSNVTITRMLQRIRRLMYGPTEKLTGIVEIDESFFGGKRYLTMSNGVRKEQPKTKRKYRRKYRRKSKVETGKGIGDKMIVFGMLQRGGPVKLFYVPSKDKETLLPLIEEHVDKSAIIYTDGNASYDDLTDMGYTHVVVKAKTDGSFSEGVHTNGIEAVWSQAQKIIFGKHVHVTKEYLQSYLDEISFRLNREDAAACLSDFLIRAFPRYERAGAAGRAHEPSL